MSHVDVIRSEQPKAAANSDEEGALYERALVRVSPCSDPLSVFCAKPSERSASR